MLRITTFLLCLFFIVPAEARQHQAASPCVRTDDVMRPCYAQSPFSGAKSIRVTMHRERKITHRQMSQAQETAFQHGDVQTRVKPSSEYRYRNNISDLSATSNVIGGRPSGCPHAFCGCGASLHLFGRIIPALNLAANWLHFPRAAPAPKMAAARRGHVMVLEEHIAGDVWLVHDSNSGHGLTRLHARSISGYTIVDPHG